MITYLPDKLCACFSAWSIVCLVTSLLYHLLVWSLVFLTLFALVCLIILFSWSLFAWSLACLLVFLINRFLGQFITDLLDHFFVWSLSCLITCLCIHFFCDQLFVRSFVYLLFVHLIVCSSHHWFVKSLVLLSTWSAWSHVCVLFYLPTCLFDQLFAWSVVNLLASRLNPIFMSCLCEQEVT